MMTPKTTMDWIANRAAHMMLGVIALAIAACSAPEARPLAPEARILPIQANDESPQAEVAIAEDPVANPVDPAPETKPGDGAEEVDPAAAEDPDPSPKPEPAPETTPEPGPVVEEGETEDDPPATPVVPPRPADPGAVAIAEAIAAAAGDDGLVTCRIRLRNQSRASANEFEAFEKRLADILDRPETRDRIRFTDGENATHELSGSAYLITSNGFDLWELYLNARTVDAAWAIWTADSPARVLRQNRPGAPQIVAWPISPRDSSRP